MKGGDLFSPWMEYMQKMQEQFSVTPIVISEKKINAQVVPVLYRESGHTRRI